MRKKEGLIPTRIITQSLQLKCERIPTLGFHWVSELYLLVQKRYIL